MPGTYWLTILPDTSKLRPAIQAAMNGVEIKPDFGVDRRQAKKAAREAQQAIDGEFDKNKPEVKPKANKPLSNRAGKEAGTTVSGAFRAAANGEKLGTEVGGKFASGLKSSLSVVGPMLAGASLFGGLKASLTEGMDFTEQLNVMGGVLGKTSAQLADVSAKARQLGADATLPGVSATTAATAMTELAKGGFDAAGAMEAVRGTLALAGAAAVDAATAAQIQSDALNTFRLGPEEANRVADLLSNAANASTVEIPQMAQALAQAGSVASGFGVSIEDTLTSLAMFANFGIKGSDAGTLMKTSLQAITDQGEPAQAAIKALNLNLYEGGKFVGYPEMLRQVAEASGKMEEEQFQAATAVLFGSDAMRGAMVAANGGAAAFSDTADKVRNGAGAIAMAEARMQGLPGAWANFQNTIDGVKLAIYDAVQGPLTGLLNALAAIPGFMSRNSTVFKALAAVIATVATPALTVWIAVQAKAVAVSIAGAIGAMIAKWGLLATAISSAAAAAGTYAIAIGRVVGASILAGLKAVAAGFVAVGTAAKGAALAMLANPIGLVIAGVVALGAALWAFFTKTEVGRELWTKAWNGIKTAASAVFDWIKEALATVGEKIEWLWKNMAVPAFEGIKGAVEGFWNGAKVVWDALTGAVDTVGQKIEALQTIFATVFNKIKETVTNAWNSISGIFDNIKDAAGTVGDLLGGAAGVVINTLGLDGNADGGRVGYATGGRIDGPGTGTSDSILGLPAMVRVSNGEYIVNAKSTAKYLPLLEALNAGALPGFAGGGLAVGKAPENGLQGNAILLSRLLSRMFPQIGSIGGYRADNLPDHPSGLALDIMIPNHTSPTGIALGNTITGFLMKNAGKLNVDYTIWRQTYRNARGQSNVMEDRGDPTQNHFDHVHVTTKPGGPSSFAAPKGLSLPGGSLGSSRMDGASVGASLTGGSTSLSSDGTLMTTRAATDKELSASADRLENANKAVVQAEQRVDDRTGTRDRAQRRLDELRASGKAKQSQIDDATDALARAERELKDATDNLTDKREKAAERADEDEKLRTEGKEVAASSERLNVNDLNDPSVAGGGGGRTDGSGDASDIGRTLVSGVLESFGLDGSLFSNPMEWPSVKSLMAGVNFVGGLASIAGASPEALAAGGGGGGFAGGVADSVGLGGLLSAIPDVVSGSPVLTPGEINPAVPGAQLAAAAGTPSSAFAPAAHGGGAGAAPGPVDNSININGNVGHDPAALRNQLRAEQSARTRTTVVK